MKKKIGLCAAVCSALIFTSLPGYAGSHDILIGRGLPQPEVKQTQTKPRGETKASRPRITQQQRRQNSDVQRALNTFDFPVGQVDGSLGKRSRGAIRDYQTFMGLGRTGVLDTAQRQDLVDAMQRYNEQGDQEFPKVLEHEGVRGLLKAYRDPNYANKYATPEPEPEEPDLTGTLPILPVIIDEQVYLSMATHCELIAGLTQANQGMVMAGNVTDPEQALGEQFCEARSYAITEGQTAISILAVTDAAMQTYCQKIAEGLKPATDLLAPQNAAAVSAKAREIVDTLFRGNMQSASTYGKICLGRGYRQDNPKVALGAATLLMAAGQMPYAEMLGHHMRWGFGTPKAQAAAKQWYQAALASIRRGDQPVFMPSKTAERNAIIDAAIHR